MKTVGVVSSVELSPWRIPQKAQSCLINQRASQLSLEVDSIVSEFVLGRCYPNLLERLQHGDVANIIFATVAQLPSDIEEMRGILRAVNSCNVHFALEDECVEREQSFEGLVYARARFDNAEVLDEIGAFTAMSDQEEQDDQPVSELFQGTRIRSDELSALDAVVKNFESFPISTREKLENFPSWVRHRDLARFLFKAEIYRSILSVPGVIFEAGVLYGGSLATWLHLGEIYEPVNYGRRVYGFDTFTGFPEVTDKDMPPQPKYPELYKAGTYSAEGAYDQIVDLFEHLDKTRKIPQIPRMRLVKGDVRRTVPETLKNDKSILVALLYLDVDLYEPTAAVLRACLPRMSKGSVICIDELCYEDWPGETEALLDVLDLNEVRIERTPIVPNIAFVRL